MLVGIRNALFAAAVSLGLFSCAESERQCRSRVQSQVAIPYSEWDPRSQADEIYRQSGPLFIVFVTSGDHVPFTTLSQEDFRAHVDTDATAMLPIGIHDLPRGECPAEVERVVRFSKQWNDRMYALVSRRTRPRQR